MTSILVTLKRRLIVTFVSGALFLGFNPVCFAESAVHRVWQKEPIDLVLPVGQERLVSFPSSVEFGFDPNSLSSNLLSVQNNAGTLYLQAKKSFAPERVQVKLKASGQSVLINLSAKEQADDTPMDIVLPGEANNRIAPTDDVIQQPHHHDIDTVSLTRFAIQSLYAPKRLLTNPPGIYRVPMQTTQTVPLDFAARFTAMPLISWRGGNHYLTAVLLRNNTSNQVTVDPSTLCGQWQAASLYPLKHLAGHGAERDTTTAFLVSNKPFAEAVSECMGGVLS